MTPKKKLIEVALPLEAINVASAREKSIRHGHPSNLHRWWARRPFVSARAVIFAQMVDDPSAHPDLFPTEKKQEKERQRLFRIIEDLVKWENTTNETVLQQARDEIWQSWRYTCAENADHPRAKELFDRHKLPAFHDPFAGGGALPLEAQRLGLESYASDLNPVAVLINKAMIEIPPKFAGKPPVNPESQRQKAQMNKSWRGAQGLADDVRYYGQWMRDQAEKRIGYLYPKVEVTAAMAKDRPDVGKYVGKKLTIIAWIWARTVKSPNPAYAEIDVPLASSFMLSAKAGKEAYVDPVVGADGYRFTVKTGNSKRAEVAKRGTKLARGANFKCLMSGTPMAPDYIKAEGKAGNMGARLMAIVAAGERERVYLSPTPEIEAVAELAEPIWVPEGAFVEDPRAFTPCIYGIKEWRHLFTSRQTVALSTFSDLVQEACERLRSDSIKASMLDDGEHWSAGVVTEYVAAVALYLSMIVSKTADSNNTLCPWEPVAQCTRQLFGRQAISMLWDFGEANLLHDSSGGFLTNIVGSTRAFESFSDKSTAGHSELMDAASQSLSRDKVISTDPPYYDNVPYADLSVFFLYMVASFPTLSFPRFVCDASGSQGRGIGCIRLSPRQQS
jgi:Adenine-specific DNA methylase containing a Zn-ribbon